MKSVERESKEFLKDSKEKIYGIGAFFKLKTPYRMSPGP